jgi:hypothetical protein
MQVRIGTNWISAALTLGSTRAGVIWPKAGVLLMAVGVLVLLAGVRIEGWKFSFHWVDRKRLWRVIYGISIMTTILGVVICYRWYQLLPYEEFVFIQDAYPTLGSPTKRAELSSRVDHYWHDNGMAIYIGESQVFYAISNDDDKRVLYQQDKHFGLQNSDYDESTIRREWKYKPPPWLGWRISECSYLNIVHIQRFDHGIVLGPVLLSPQAPDTENIAIFDDGTTSVRKAAEKFEKRECL